MDTFVEKAGVSEQEKQIPVTPTKNEKQIEAPIENAETASAPLNEEDTTELKSQDEERDQQIKVVRSKEKPDTLGRKIASLPWNAMKAGYDYAFGKELIKR